MSQNTTHFFDIVLTLLRHKVTLLLIIVPITVLSLIVSLVWPQTFRSSSEVVQLQQSAPSVGGVLQNFASINLSRDRVGGETMLVILNSQSLRNKIIDEFDLEEVYGTDIQEALLNNLNQNITISESREGGFGFNPIVSIRLSVTDRDPERAQKMNQFILSELDAEMKRYNRLSSEEMLEILENRYEQNLVELEEAERRLNTFQNEYGILQLDSQASAVIENLASLKAEITSKEIELAVLGNVLERNSQRFKSKQLELRELENRYRSFIQRSENLSDVEDTFYSLYDLPDLFLQYIRLQRDVEIQQAINESLFPQLEQQRISYRNSSSGLKFVDEPNFPTYKDSPKRAIITLAGMFFSIFLALIVVFIRELLKDPESESAKKIKEIQAELSFRK